MAFASWFGSLVKQSLLTIDTPIDGRRQCSSRAGEVHKYVQNIFTYIMHTSKSTPNPGSPFTLPILISLVGIESSVSKHCVITTHPKECHKGLWFKGFFDFLLFVDSVRTRFASFRHAFHAKLN